MVTVMVRISTICDCYCWSSRCKPGEGEDAMRRFPKNEIVSLIGETPRYDLGESVGPDLHLDDLLSASGLRNIGEVPLGYGTAQGDLRLRRDIADFHAVTPDDVVVTV